MEHCFFKKGRKTQICTHIASLTCFLFHNFRPRMRLTARRTKSGTRRSSSAAKTASSRAPSRRSSPGNSASASAEGPPSSSQSRSLQRSLWSLQRSLWSLHGQCPEVDRGSLPVVVIVFQLVMVSDMRWRTARSVACP